MNWLGVKIFMFTFINRLSQQKWNASFSDCDLFVLGENPSVPTYLDYL